MFYASSSGYSPTICKNSKFQRIRDVGSSRSKAGDRNILHNSRECKINIFRGVFAKKAVQLSYSHPYCSLLHEWNENGLTDGSQANALRIREVLSSCWWRYSPDCGTADSVKKRQGLSNNLRVPLRNPTLSRMISFQSEVKSGEM